MKDVYDVVVVGAGGAGMTAALAAARQGLDTVLIEKSNYFGGSTARSGGGVWIPGNYALRAAGEADDPEESKRYLEAIVGDVVPKERRDTFVDRGPEVMDFVRDHTPVRFAWVPEYSDYLPESPGGRARGRSVEPVPMDCRFLGEELAHLHPPYSKAPANLIVTQADFRKISLGMRTIRGPITMMKIIVRRIVAACAAARCTRWATPSPSGCARGSSTRACPWSTAPSCATSSSRTDASPACECSATAWSARSGRTAASSSAVAASRRTSSCASGSGPSRSASTGRPAPSPTPEADTWPAWTPEPTWP